MCDRDLVLPTVISPRILRQWHPKPPEVELSNAVAAVNQKKKTARKQVKHGDAVRTETLQTAKECNIRWAGGDREDSYSNKVKSSTRVNVVRDSGPIRVNVTGIKYTCFYLARDCFAREKFADHWDDMGGGGSFRRQNRTLYVGRIKETGVGLETEEMYGSIEKNAGQLRGTYIVLINKLRATAATYKRATNRPSSVNETRQRWTSRDPGPYGLIRAQSQVPAIVATSRSILSSKPPTITLRLTCLSFLASFFASHPPPTFATSLSNLTPALLRSLGERHPRIASETFRVFSALLNAVKPIKGGNEWPEAVYEQSVARLTAHDTDTEVRACAETCIGDLWWEAICRSGAKAEGAVKVVTRVAKEVPGALGDGWVNGCVEWAMGLLKRGGRAGKMEVFQGLEVLLRSYTSGVPNNLPLALIPQVKGYLSTSDIPLLSQALSLLALLLELAPKITFPEIESDLLPEVYRIAHSPLVSGVALDSLLSFIAALVSAHDQIGTHLVPNLVIAVEKAPKADASPGNVAKAVAQIMRNQQSIAAGTIAQYAKNRQAGVQGQATLHARVKDPNPSSTATVVSAQSYDELLAPLIVDFLSMMFDEDITVRRLALSTLNSAAPTKPHLNREHLTLTALLPSLYTVINVDLIRTVQMDPWTDKVDEGLDARETAYETMYTRFGTCLAKLGRPTFLVRVIPGLVDDSDEIKAICRMMLSRLSQVAPAAVSPKRDEATPDLEKTMNGATVTKDTVKERAAELQRSALGAVEQCRDGSAAAARCISGGEEEARNGQLNSRSKLHSTNASPIFPTPPLPADPRDPAIFSTDVDSVVMQRQSTLDTRMEAVNDYALLPNLSADAILACLRERLTGQIYARMGLPVPPITKEPIPPRSQVTLAGPLNMLDSVSSEEGRLTFATTNHIEQLDSALIHPGRIENPLQPRDERAVWADVPPVLPVQGRHDDAGPAIRCYYDPTSPEAGPGYIARPTLGNDARGARFGLRRRGPAGQVLDCAAPGVFAEQEARHAGGAEGCRCVDCRVGEGQEGIEELKKRGKREEKARREAEEIEELAREEEERRGRWRGSVPSEVAVDDAEPEAKDVEKDVASGPVSPRLRWIAEGDSHPLFGTTMASITHALTALAMLAFFEFLWSLELWDPSHAALGLIAVIVIYNASTIQIHREDTASLVTRASKGPAAEGTTDAASTGFGSFDANIRALYWTLGFFVIAKISRALLSLVYAAFLPFSRLPLIYAALNPAFMAVVFIIALKFTSLKATIILIVVGIIGGDVALQFMIRELRMQQQVKTSERADIDDHNSPDVLEGLQTMNSSTTAVEEQPSMAMGDVKLCRKLAARRTLRYPGVP
ncbi:Cullin-associated nedd8-dissociated protein 1 [Mycena kentingensis (nom. inval.)]|nr:Cullin-associated nedd8-dissociated protein 1 [Mycena kentingensis (nom. inval.)]